MASKAGWWVCAGGLGLVLACDPGAARVELARDEAPRPVLSAAGRGAMEAGPDRGSDGAVRMAGELRLEIAKISTPVAEDGHGGRVTSPPDPRALDVHGPAWRGRALDPVLRIGELRFHHYTFPAKGVMRFVVDDVARLHGGEEAWLQWGDDASSKIVLTRSLEVPR